MSSSASYLPDIWQDDNRMAGLMSMFKLRHVNAQDYDRKMQFWIDVIAKSCASLGDPVVNLSKLKARFRRRDQIPATLATVLTEMQTRKELQTVKEASDGANGWMSWGFSLVTLPVSWIFGGVPDANNEDLVHMPTVKLLAAKILQVHAEHEPEADDVADLVDYCTLRDQCQSHFASHQAFDLALHYLLRDGQISVHQASNGEKVIKFREERENGPVKFTETDTNIHDVRKAMTKLEKEIARLDENAKRYELEARVSLRAGNRAKAKNQLRQKQLVMKQLGEKDAQYGRLLGILHQLGQSRQNKQVLDAYKAGLQAFRGNLDRHGMSPSQIDETMDSVQEALADYDDISLAMSQGVTDSTVDMDSLEAELAQLVEEPEADLLGQLPAVPTDDMIPSPGAKPTDRLQQLRQQLHAQ